MVAVLLLLIAGCVRALPDLAEAPRLTLEELVGAGTFAPPTLGPLETASSSASSRDDFTIPPNPEAAAFRRPIKGIRLPVFDASKKWDGPPIMTENRDRIVKIPEAAFHVEFDKNHPVERYNASEPIHLELSKFISAKFECGFCLKIVARIKEEIGAKGAQGFTEELLKSCEGQKEAGKSGHTDCALIQRVKVDRLASESVEQLCLSEQRCKSHQEIVDAEARMAELAQSNKEEEEMRRKWREENEKARQIVEAQDAAWRREFKRTHPETLGLKPLLLNLPPGVESLPENDDWKPDFGGWNAANETFDGKPRENAPNPAPETVAAAEGEDGTAAAASASGTPFGSDLTGSSTESPQQQPGAAAAAAAAAGAFKSALPEKPSIDFVHEVLTDTVQKEDSAVTAAAAPAAAAPSADAESDVEEAFSSISAPTVESAPSSGGGGLGAETSTVDGVSAAEAEGAEPSPLFSSTEAAAHFTKSQEEAAGEEQARRTLQEAILEAKKAVDEDVGFMSKPVVTPSPEDRRPPLHEFVPSPSSSLPASARLQAAAAATVAELTGAAAAAAAAGQQPAADVEPTIPPPVRAPVQCGPARKTQFSARPTAAAASAADGISSSRSPSDAVVEAALAAGGAMAAAAATDAEPEAVKVEAGEQEQEGPAKMAVPRARPMRVVNRLVQTQFSVDDIA